MRLFIIIIHISIVILSGVWWAVSTDPAHAVNEYSARIDKSSHTDVHHFVGAHRTWRLNDFDNRRCAPPRGMSQRKRSPREETPARQWNSWNHKFETATRWLISISILSGANVGGGGSGITVHVCCVTPCYYDVFSFQHALHTYTEAFAFFSPLFRLRLLFRVWQWI